MTHDALTVPVEFILGGDGVLYIDLGAGPEVPDSRTPVYDQLRAETRKS